MKLHELIEHLVQLRLKHGPEVEVVAKIADLMLTVQTVEVEELVYPSGPKVIALQTRLKDEDVS